MAGRQHAQAAILTLIQRLAHEEMGEDATAFDWYCARIAGGDTQLALAAELTEKAEADGLRVARSTLTAAVSRMIRETPNGQERVREAEAARASVRLDRAEQVIEEAETREEIQKAGLTLNAAQWRAARESRERYGDPKPTTNVQVNLGTMHLDAFRALRATASVYQSPQEARSLPEPAMDMLPPQIEAPEGVEAA